MRHSSGGGLGVVVSSADILIAEVGGLLGQPLNLTISAAILLISMAALGVTLFDRKN